jgi:hypothetical protein
MGFRFRRSIRVLPGVRINVGKKGISTSIGGRGAHVTIGHGKVRSTVGLPGSGISYTTTQSLGGHTSTSRIGDSAPRDLSAGGCLGILILIGVGAVVIAGVTNRDPTPVSATSTASTNSGASVLTQSASGTARTAAIQRCERAFRPGDALMRCITRESDCVRKYGENVDPTSPSAAAQTACFEAVQLQRKRTRRAVDVSPSEKIREGG